MLAVRVQAVRRELPSTTSPTPARITAIPASMGTLTVSLANSTPRPTATTGYTASMRVTRGGQELQLSPIGLRLLAILMRESPKVISRRDIEREIWGDGLPDSDTLRSHLYNLRKTIDRAFDKPLLHTVQSAGYRIADLDAPQA